MYKIVNDKEGNALCVKRLEGIAFIPFDPANTDYQQYLAWVAEGNTVLPADENNDG